MLVGNVYRTRLIPSCGDSIVEKGVIGEEQKKQRKKANPKRPDGSKAAKPK
jgi:hypothetical protein